MLSPKYEVRTQYEKKEKEEGEEYPQRMCNLGDWVKPTPENMYSSKSRDIHRDILTLCPTEKKLNSVYYEIHHYDSTFSINNI